MYKLVEWTDNKEEKQIKKCVAYNYKSYALLQIKLNIVHSLAGSKDGAWPDLP